MDVFLFSTWMYFIDDDHKEPKWLINWLPDSWRVPTVRGRRERAWWRKRRRPNCADRPCWSGTRSGSTGKCPSWSCGTPDTPDRNKTKKETHLFQFFLNFNWILGFLDFCEFCKKLMFLPRVFWIYSCHWKTRAEPVFRWNGSNCSRTRRHSWEWWCGASGP